MSFGAKIARRKRDKMRTRRPPALVRYHDSCDLSSEYTHSPKREQFDTIGESPFQKRVQFAELYGRKNYFSVELVKPFEVVVDGQKRVCSSSIAT